MIKDAEYLDTKVQKETGPLVNRVSDCLSACMLHGKPHFKYFRPRSDHIFLCKVLQAFSTAWWATQARLLTYPALLYLFPFHNFSLDGPFFFFPCLFTLPLCLPLYFTSLSSSTGIILFVQSQRKDQLVSITQAVFRDLVGRSSDTTHFPLYY